MNIVFVDFTELFDALKEIQGNLDTKCAFVEDIRNEALRFKRRTLSRLLQHFSASLRRNHNEGLAKAGKHKTKANHVDGDKSPPR